MFRTVFSLSCLTILAIAGCGSRDAAPAFEPAEWRGSVDTSLPASVQAKQDALIRLFTAIQDVGIERIAWDCPDIKFSETFDEFFEGTVDFYRWEWAAEPDGDHFKVRLILRRDDAELTEVEHVRTYEIRRRGASFIIQRVAEGQAP